MLFDEKISVCRIVKDSNYVIGKQLDMDISFGGMKDCFLHKESFETLKSLGILPMSAQFLESVVGRDKTDILYFVVNTSGDISKDTIEYRKVCVSRKVSNIEYLKSFIVEEIKECLDPFYFHMINRSLDLVSLEEKKPTLYELSRGLKALKSVHSSFNHIKKVDSSAYCNIDGVTYIVAIKEGDTREFLLLPVEYSEDALIDYLNIISGKSREKIKEILASISD